MTPIPESAALRRHRALLFHPFRDELLCFRGQKNFPGRWAPPPQLLAIGLPVKDTDCVQFPNDHVFPADSEVRPRFVVAHFSFVEKLDFFRIRSQQQKQTSLIQSENKIVVCDHAAILSERRGGPSAFACAKVNACESLVLQMHVGVVVDDNRSGHVSLDAVAPRFGTGEFSVRPGHPEQPGFVLVGTCEDAISNRHGGQNVHASKTRHFLFPQDIAAIRIDSGKLLTSLHEDLAFPRESCHDWRRKGAAHHAPVILQDTPDDPAGVFVELYERGTGLNIQPFAIEQG